VNTFLQLLLEDKFSLYSKKAKGILKLRGLTLDATFQPQHIPEILASTSQQEPQIKAEFFGNRLPQAETSPDVKHFQSTMTPPPVTSTNVPLLDNKSPVKEVITITDNMLEDVMDVSSPQFPSQMDDDEIMSDLDSVDMAFFNRIASSTAGPSSITNKSETVQVDKFDNDDRFFDLVLVQNEIKLAYMRLHGKRIYGDRPDPLATFSNQDDDDTNNVRIVDHSDSFPDYPLGQDTDFDIRKEAYLKTINRTAQKLIVPKTPRKRFYYKEQFQVTFNKQYRKFFNKRLDFLRTHFRNCYYATVRRFYGQDFTRFNHRLDFGIRRNKMYMLLEIKSEFPEVDDNTSAKMFSSLNSLCLKFDNYVKSFVEQHQVEIIN